MYVNQLKSQLSLPVIAAPMFLVSGLQLVQSCCLNGIVGSFPAANARTLDDLREWLTQMTSFAKQNPQAAPFAVNIILLDKMNARKNEELALLKEFKVPILITSVGDPTDVVAMAHEWGGLVLHDVISLRHAQKAIAAKVDGLILVCAGAGGHTGQLSPFAFVEQVREIWQGLLVVGGAINNGKAIKAVQVLGGDLAYMGTRFIATHESLSSTDYKKMLIDAGASDIVLSATFSGVPAHYMQQSIVANGLDPKNYTAEQVREKGIKPWRDVWSAGHGVGGIHEVEALADVITALKNEYETA